MEDEYTPPTQPSGSLVPPRKIPGTAVGIATPPPPRPESIHPTERRGFLHRMLKLTLDSVDDFADAVAAGLGLRHR